MTFTPFGFIFITLGLTLLIARPEWLLLLLIVSAVFQGFAVAVIGQATEAVGLGVTPWLFTSFLIFVHAGFLIYSRRTTKFITPRYHKILVIGWLVFIGWCALSSFILPIIFKGTPVHPLANYNGFVVPLESLTWNLVNAVQATNASIIGMLFIYIFLLRRNKKLTTQIMMGFCFAALLSIFFTICHRLEMSGIEVPLKFLHQSLNPSYNPGTNPFRPFFPFSEPSYASVWYSGLLLGGLTIFVFTQSTKLGGQFIVIGLLGLLLSQGGSGLSGSVIALLVLFAGIPVVVYIKVVSIRQVLVRIVAILISAILLLVIYEVTRENLLALPDILTSIRIIFLERAMGNMTSRGQSNVDALMMVNSTFGIGVGLGSNRASSYILSMLSNIGVLGTLLFSALICYQAYLLICKTTSANSAGVFFGGGMLAVLMGLTMGIPDLLFPAWWIWLLAGFGVVVSDKNYLVHIK